MTGKASAARWRRASAAVVRQCNVSRLDRLDWTIGSRMVDLKPYLQVGCRLVTDGPYWNPKNQGMVATVVKTADAGTVTVRCDIACRDKS